MAARGSLTIIFPEQVQSVDTSSISSSSSITTSGESVTTTTNDGQTYSVAFALVDGYKINGADFTPSVNGGILDSFTDSTVDITAGAAGIDGTLTITVQQSESTTKTVSSDNLARFKQKCDETYAKIGEGGGGGKLYMHSLVLDTSASSSLPYTSVKVDILSVRSTAYTKQTMADDFAQNKFLSTVFHYTPPEQVGEGKVEGFFGFVSSISGTGSGNSIALYDMYLSMSGTQVSVPFEITSDNIVTI